MMMIIRGLAGVLIGVAYGVFVSGLVFLLLRPDQVKPASGLLIMIDPVAMAWIGVAASGIITGLCAAVIGLIVRMARLGKAKAAILGFAIGLLVFGLLNIGSGPRLPQTLLDWITLLVIIVILPVGLALTGMVVAIAGDKLTDLLNGR
jgi:hypothetical protein